MDNGSIEVRESVSRHATDSNGITAAAQDAWLQEPGARAAAKTQVVHALTEFQNQYLPMIDFDGNRHLSKEELQEAIDGEYLPAKQAALAQVMVDTYDSFSSLSWNAKQGVSQQGLEILRYALDPETGLRLNNVLHPAGVSGIFGAAGCIWGGLLGSAALNPLAGCAIGATLAGGASYPFLRRSHNDRVDRIRHQGMSVAAKTLRSMLETTRR